MPDQNIVIRCPKTAIRYTTASFSPENFAIDLGAIEHPTF